MHLIQTEALVLEIGLEDAFWETDQSSNYVVDIQNICIVDKNVDWRSAM